MQICICIARRFWALLNDQHLQHVWISCGNALKQGSHLGNKMPFSRTTCKVFSMSITIFMCNSRRFWALLNDQHVHPMWISCEHALKRGSHLGIKMPFPEITCKLFWIIILIFMCNSRRFWALLNDQHPHQMWIACEKALKWSYHLGIRMPFPKMTCKLFYMMILIFMCNSRRF